MPLSSISSAAFSFKKLPDFSPFFADRVRLGNRTYRVWVKIGLKDGELNGSAPSYVEFTLNRTYAVAIYIAEDFSC